MKKFKILMVNLPFSGHTNPTLGLSRELVRMGHEVTYILSPDWREKIIETGAAFIPYDDYPADISEAKKEFMSWQAAYYTVIRVAESGDYDCLIYEMLFIQGKSLADRLGLPAVRLFSTFTQNRKVLEEFGRTGGPYFTAVFRYKMLYRFASRFMKRKFRIKYQDIIHEIVENAPDLNFTYTIREFQIYQEQFSERNYKYIGPAIEWNDKYKDDTRTERTTLIYISLGTLLNGSVSFFRQCMEAFRGQPVKVIVSLGHKVKRAELGEIPDNFSVHRFVPQLEVLSKCDLFITHGGMNSVNEAIYFGVPMLVIPMGNDQPTVANQVRDLRLGRRLMRRGLSAEEIRREALAILNDQRYRERLEEFRQLSRKAGGNRLAAKLITEYLEN